MSFTNKLAKDNSCSSDISWVTQIVSFMSPDHPVLLPSLLLREYVLVVFFIIAVVVVVMSGFHFIKKYQSNQTDQTDNLPDIVIPPDQSTRNDESLTEH
jgi:hypothetical protein